MPPTADLSVDACVTILGTCPVEYLIAGNLVEFNYGRSRDGFHFAFDVAALEQLMSLGREAVTQLEAQSSATD